MESGYSRLLLHEWILPDEGAHWSLTCMGWELISSLSSRQHTESELRPFADGTGLRLVRVWMNPSGAGDGVVEYEVS